MRFNPVHFDRFLSGNIGQEVIWRQSFSCACLNPDTGSPNPKHALCGGKGRLWAEGKKTTIGIAKQDVDDKLVELGHFEAGDMIAVIPANSPAWAAGEWDRIQMLNGTDVFSQPMKRGSPTEKFIVKVKSVSRVFWLDNAGQIVEGGIPVVAADGTLSWPGGVGEPPPGAQYSISGEKYTEYYIYGHFPSDRNQHKGMKLPKRCILRKFDVFNR